LSSVVLPPGPSQPRGRPVLSCPRSDDAPAGSARVMVGGERGIATVPELAGRCVRRPWSCSIRARWSSSTAAARRSWSLADRRVRRAAGRLVVVRGSAEVNWRVALMGIDRQLKLIDRPPAADTTGTVVGGVSA
jgi:hypothetical protein